MNPARSLGPAVFGGSLGDAWIYVLGPLVGALVAVLTAHLLRGAPKPAEVESASGKDHPPKNDATTDRSARRRRSNDR